MSSSENFPPPPREMYTYSHNQQVINGHTVASTPPLTSTSSRGSDYVGRMKHDYHPQQYIPQQSNKAHQDNKSLLSLMTHNPQQDADISRSRGRAKANVGLRNSSPENYAQNRPKGNVNHANFQRFLIEGPVLQAQNNATMHERNHSPRERVTSPAQRLMAGGRGQHSSGAFHVVQKQSEGKKNHWVQPGSNGQHRPTLTYVPPPVVPNLHIDHRQAQNAATNRNKQIMHDRHQMIQKYQQHEHHRILQQQQHQQQQQQQQKQQQQQQQQQQYFKHQHMLQQQVQKQNMINNNETHFSGMRTDIASQRSNHNHGPQPHHHSHHYHQQQLHGTTPAVSSSHLPRLPTAVSSSVSPTFSPASMPDNLKTNRIPSVSPTFSSTSMLDNFKTSRTSPATSASPASLVHDRFVNAHSQSSPFSPIPTENDILIQSRSITNDAPLIRPSPMIIITSHAVNPSLPPQKLCLSSPNLNEHSYRHVDFQPIDNPYETHHQVEAPATLPVLPVRTCSTLQVPSHHRRDLSPESKAKFPFTLSPIGQPNDVSHESKSFPRFATMDDLARVKLRAVNDTFPRPTVIKTPFSPEDLRTGIISFPIRPVPSQYSTSCEEETTLPPPPPLDDLDELPPPPPPHELLVDPASLSFDSVTSHHQHNSKTHSFHLQKPLPHIPAGEANSSQIYHQSLRRQQFSSRDSGSGSKDKSVDDHREAKVKVSSVPERLISMANTNFEIPDDIDLSKCPGLVEINRSTPNWKRDVIEKKNQEKIEEYVKAVLKERELEAKWKDVPEWKKKILQKKEEEDVATGSVNKCETKPTSKKPGKKPPVPPPKDVNVDLSSSKAKGDIVPAALSIDPEELAAMPPWKRELLFKRDKVPVTFSNEFNPEDGSAESNDNSPAS